MTFELTYNAPDGSVGMWQRGGFEKLKSDELRKPLSESELNELNIRHSRSGDRSDDLTSDTISMVSNKSSLKGSKISLASSNRGSGGRSPRPWVYWYSVWGDIYKSMPACLSFCLPIHMSWYLISATLPVSLHIFWWTFFEWLDTVCTLDVHGGL